MKCYSGNVVRRQDCTRTCLFSAFVTAAVFPLWLVVCLDNNVLLCLVFSGFSFLNKCSILWNLKMAILPPLGLSQRSPITQWDNTVPWTLPAMLPDRLMQAQEIWTSVFALLYPDMSFRDIVCRITEEITQKQGNPLLIFMKSSVLLGKHFPAQDSRNFQV